MQKILALIALCFLFSCGNENTSNKLIVKGNIKGLKKGSVYLKKAQDSILVTVDSLEINGNSQFELSTNIEEPELFFLYLNKNTGEDSSITFFGNTGITEINTSLKNFVYDAKIKGSKEQSLLDEYNAMISKFNNKGLELIKEKFDATKAKDITLINKTQKTYNGLEKRKYLYTTNFALNNKDSQIAPYLAITQLYNANIKLLDTINVSLSQKVKDSKYGKKLQHFLNRIKKEE